MTMELPVMADVAVMVATDVLPAPLLAGLGVSTGCKRRCGFEGESRRAMSRCTTVREERGSMLTASQLLPPQNTNLSWAPQPAQIDMHDTDIPFGIFHSGAVLEAIA
jgi:hypothetical protein